MRNGIQIVDMAGIGPTDVGVGLHDNNDAQE